MQRWLCEASDAGRLTCLALLSCPELVCDRWHVSPQLQAPRCLRAEQRQTRMTTKG